MNGSLRSFLAVLAEYGMIRFGDFLLKSGKRSGIYIDLRPLVSYPYILWELASLFAEKISSLSFEYLAGVPMNGIPLATAVSLRTGEPMLLVRKEAKEHGTKKMIEGVFETGKQVLLVDDVITTGASKLETIATLANEGLIVQDVVVVIDRGQGGKEELSGKGIALHALCTMQELLTALLENGILDRPRYEELVSELGLTKEGIHV